jgi:hypothetical protein
VVFTIAVWIAGGWAFLDSSSNPRPKPTPVAEKSVAVTEKSAAVDKPTPITKPVEPAPAAVVATDYPPKLLEAQPSPEPQSPPSSAAVSPPVASANQTPAVVDEEPVDPAARELITQGWVLCYLPYTPVRWQAARRDFERALELDTRSSEARIGLASILSIKLADGWSPVLQEDMPRAEHLLLEAIDKGGVLLSSPGAGCVVGRAVPVLTGVLPRSPSEWTWYSGVCTTM